MMVPYGGTGHNEYKPVVIHSHILQINLLAQCGFMHVINITSISGEVESGSTFLQDNPTSYC